MTSLTEHFSNVSMVSWISEIEKHERLQKTIQERLETMEMTSIRRREDRERREMKRAYLEQKRLSLLASRDTPVEKSTKSVREGGNVYDRLYTRDEVAADKAETVEKVEGERRRRRVKREEEDGLKRVVSCARTLTNRLQKLDMVLKQVDGFQERQSQVRLQKHLREHKQPRKALMRAEEY